MSRLLHGQRAQLSIAPVTHLRLPRRHVVAEIPPHQFLRPLRHPQIPRPHIQIHPDQIGIVRLHTLRRIFQRPRMTRVDHAAPQPQYGDGQQQVHGFHVSSSLEYAATAPIVPYFISSVFFSHATISAFQCCISGAFHPLIPCPPPSIAISSQFAPTAFIADRKSTRLNSSHLGISYAVFC